jgi:ketosteroid isomerase-like protein
MSPLAIARACLQAYVDKNRAAIEALLADDFRFTSPIDNGLDRATYLARCWPNSESMRAATVVQAAENCDRAFVVYEAETGGKRFRNCEMHTTRDGKLVSVEVYFGWNLPHPAGPGQFVENDGNA